MVRLSYSKVSDFETCPRKYFLTSVKGVPTLPNEAMERGRRVHELLHQSTMAEDWKSFLLEHAEYNDFKDMIDNYIVYQEKSIIKSGANPKPKFAEIKLYDDKLDFSLIIDRVDEHNGRVLITDYKSGRPEQNAHDKQLFLYAHFYNKMFPDKKATHVAPFFIKTHKGIKAKEVTEEKTKEVMKWLLDMKKDIESRDKDMDKFETKPNKFCKGCTHFLRGICKEGKAYVEAQSQVTEMGEFE